MDAALTPSPDMPTLALLAVVAAIVLFVVVVARRPSDFRVERSTTVAAPPGAVLELVEDFHNWHRWSPWDKLDPTQVLTFGGAPRGLGATYHWVGDKNGEGHMEIVEHRPNEKVGIQLDFIRPFATRNRCDFTARRTDAGTEVTWSMSGTYNLMMKAFCLFKDMDSMVGRDFERGLADLKAAAEASTGAKGGTASAPGGVRSPA